jgi:1D-myo-inositol-tetrakisphosphate 5-kinase/inositol-polyphosphate multikinase
MDIKLGTMLYDAHGPITEAKKIRMTEQAKNTTSKDTGFRVTGFQVRYQSVNAVEVKESISLPRCLKIPQTKSPWISQSREGDL